MTGGGLVLGALAAAIHVAVFVLESLLWMRPSTRAAFRVASERDAQTTPPLAFNQGFYNLFLAAVTTVGIVLVATGGGAGTLAAGSALILAGAGSMIAAGIVLIASSPNLLRAALVQLVPPALGLIALAFGA